MKTLVILHGGESWNSETEYQDFLRNDYRIEPFDPTIVQEIGWKETLRNKAAALGWTVFMPTFPCKHHAKYDEWKTILGRTFEMIPADSEITIVGHSLGGNLALKYMAETSLPDRKIAGIHLVAACYDVGSFHNPTDSAWNHLAAYGDRVHIWQAQDDMVVPFTDAEHIHGRLPESQYYLFETGGHFRMPEFPELEAVVFGTAE